MASKSSKRDKSRPAAAAEDPAREVARLIEKGRLKDAVKQAKITFKDAPTPEHRRLLERAYLLRAQQLHRDRMPESAREVARHLVDFGVTDPALLEEAGRLLMAVGMAQEARVPVLLINPISNLDTPPFKSEHRPGLSRAERRRFDACWGEARRHYGKNLPEAIHLLRQAIAIDDQHAGIHYTLAKCYQQSGRMEEARRSFLAAKECDVCPLRILEPMSQAVFDVGRETGTPVVDLVEIFSARSRGGIPGDDWLVDHVHPSIRGHQLVARVLLDEMAREGWLAPSPGWEAERDRQYKAQLASLDEFYFLKGEKQLGNLRLWAQGRGDRVRPLTKPDASTDRVADHRDTRSSGPAQPFGRPSSPVRPARRLKAGGRAWRVRGKRPAGSVRLRTSRGRSIPGRRSRRAGRTG